MRWGAGRRSKASPESGEEPATAGGPDLSRWRAADRIEVRSNLNILLRTVDEDSVRAIAERLAGLEGGWTVPARGVRVARVRFELHAGDRFLGSVGIGESFVSAHQSGTFWSRPSEPAFKGELMRMAGLG